MSWLKVAADAAHNAVPTVAGSKTESAIEFEVVGDRGARDSIDVPGGSAEERD